MESFEFTKLAGPPGSPLIFPGHENCFICGQGSESMGVRWFSSERGVYGLTSLETGHMGPPGLVHGGALAAMLDEAMVLALALAGQMGVSANLNLDYRKPSFLGSELKVEGWLERVEGRKIYTRGLVQIDDTVTVEATSLYITPREGFF